MVSETRRNRVAPACTHGVLILVLMEDGLGEQESNLLKTVVYES